MGHQSYDPGLMAPERRPDRASSRELVEIDLFNYLGPLGIKVAPRTGLIFQDNLIAPRRQFSRGSAPRDLSASLAARIIPSTQIKIMPIDNMVQSILVLPGVAPVF